MAELGEDGQVAASFVYATRGNVPDYMVKAGHTYRLITDQVGSVRLVVDAQSGSVEQEIEYDAFGRVLSDSNPGFQPFGFAGGIFDPDTGLTHFGAREYDAELGRWTSADPISFAGGDGNLYGYVVQDPVDFVDPLGQKALKPLRPVRQPSPPGFSGGGGGGGWAADCTCAYSDSDPYNLSPSRWECGSSGDGPDTDTEPVEPVLPMPEHPAPGWGPGWEPIWRPVPTPAWGL